MCDRVSPSPPKNALSAFLLLSVIVYKIIEVTLTPVICSVRYCVRIASMSGYCSSTSKVTHDSAMKHKTSNNTSNFDPSCIAFLWFVLIVSNRWTVLGHIFL